MGHGELLGKRSGFFGETNPDPRGSSSRLRYARHQRRCIRPKHRPRMLVRKPHWAVVDIPVRVTALGLSAGEADSSLPAGRHITNDGGLRHYLGAAPPPGPAHHYYIVYIVVTALDVPTTGVPDTASPALALFQTLDHVVA